MSRIGRAPIKLPANVEFKFENGIAKVKGPLGELTQEIDSKISIAVENGEIKLSRANDEQEVRAKHGLYRALINNMVKGVTVGYEKILVINGVGYKVNMQGENVVLNIGFSHPIEFKAVNGIKLSCPSATEISVKGIDKVVVGQTAASIRALREPEPYHGYGIRYKDEVIVRKQGKVAGK